MRGLAPAGVALAAASWFGAGQAAPSRHNLLSPLPQLVHDEAPDGDEAYEREGHSEHADAPALECVHKCTPTHAHKKKKHGEIKLEKETQPQLPVEWRACAHPQNYTGRAGT